MNGTVIKSTGSWYDVQCTDGRVIACKIKGKFRLKGFRSTSPIAIGDYVDVKENADDTGFIVAIKKRKNFIIRKASNLSKQSHILAANLDIALLFITIKYPETTTVFIDRFLASAEAYDVPVYLVFNKIDKYGVKEKERLDQLLEVYQSIGYSCFCIDALHRKGIESLYSLLKDNVTMIAGHSGVGKSTFINTLLPDLDLRTQELSDSHNTGMHTTTCSEMYALPQGGYIIDMPGIKGFGTVLMKKEEIPHYFRDIFKSSKRCKYNNCLHLSEPNCAVLEDVENGVIAASRYHSYLNILEECIQEDKYRENHY